MKTEGVEQGQRADRPAAIAAADGVAGVVDQGQAVLARDRLQGVVVAGLAGVVDGHHGLRARRDAGLDLAGIDEQGIGIDVDEDRRRAQERGAVGAGGKGHRGHDHLVARADAQGIHGGVQRGGAGAHGHGVGRAGHGRQGLLELGDLGPRGQPVGAQRLRHRGHVVVVDRLPPVGQQPGADGRAAVNGQPWLRHNALRRSAATRRSTSIACCCRWCTRSPRPAVCLRPSSTCPTRDARAE